MKKIRKIISTAILLAICFFYTPINVHAESASLYLSPSSATQQVGNVFTVYVAENSGGNAVNAFEGTVNFPDNLTVTGANFVSICTIPVRGPTITGNSVSFKCGLTGTTTASGNILQISVRASNVGSGNANITGARILANAGENVTGGVSGGTYTVTAAATAPSGNTGSNTGGNTGGSTNYGTSSPSISSANFPDQNAWYKSNAPSFSWNKAGGITGFSYVFDQNAGTVPASTVNTSETGVSFKDKADGVWYLHVRANSSRGWSNTSHYRVQIDVTAPSSIEVITDPKVEADKRPMVSFNAVDAASGIDHYELKMDKGEFKTVTSPYTPESINSGDHVFTVRAVDKAGNILEGSANIKIKDIRIPKITKPTNNSIFKLAQQLDIDGTADPSTVVDVYFDGVNIARGVKVDGKGNWHYGYQSFIMPGKHKIFAIAVKDGIESKLSQEIVIRIDPSAINIFGVLVPSYLVFIALLVVIVLLTLLFGWLLFIARKKYKEIRDKVRTRNKEARVIVEKSFDKIEDKIREEVQGTYEDNKPKTPKEEHDLEGKIEHDIDATRQSIEETIENEVKDL